MSEGNPHKSLVDPFFKTLIPGARRGYSDFMITVKVDLPEQLYEQLREFVAHGWSSSESELVQEALRRFLEARAPELMSRFIKEDMEWGLRGND